MTKNEPDRVAREPSLDEKRLVVVVHGIGDEEPGAAVGLFARAVAAASGRARRPAEEVLWLPEGSGRQVEDFPCHVERLCGAGAETVLAEVYWADLSRLGHRLLATLLGFLRLIFGFHHLVARHCTDPARRRSMAADRTAETLQKLSLVIAHLLRGPVAAAMLLWGLGWAIGIGVLSLGSGSIDEETWAVRIPIAVGLIGVSVGSWGFRRRRERLDTALFLWLVLFGLTTVAATALVDFMFWPEAPSLGGLWVKTLRIASWPQLVAQLLIVLAAAAWLIARLRADPKHRPGLDLAQAANYAVFGLCLMVIRYLTTIIIARLPEEAALGQVRAFMGGLKQTILFDWSLALITVVVALVTLGARRRWAMKTSAGSYDAARPAPRLLLAWSILTFLLGLPILLIVLSVFAPEFMSKLFGALNEVDQVVVPAAAFLGTVAIYGSEQLRAGVDFGLDVVSHFESQVSNTEGRPVFVRRERIRQRLRIALKALIRQEEPNRVTILAHSQGTIVAVEALAEEESPLEPLAECDLVTMGSPFHHIYNHYFPNDYPPLTDERWDGLRQRVDRWLNIFRIDDYVGTDIEPGGDWPENCPVDPGGHTGYWRDRQVLQILQDRRLV